MITVKIVKYDVYKDGTINDAVIRTSKFVFEKEKDAGHFIEKVSKVIGIIEVLNIKS